VLRKEKLMRPFPLSILPYKLAICRLDPDAPLPGDIFQSPFWSVTYTGDEISVIVPEENVPASCQSENHWSCLKVRGPLDFGLTGILASLTAPLAEAGIPVFALSTFETDYLMVKDSDLEETIAVLRNQGHHIGKP
jgi:uncharacterized protein